MLRGSPTTSRADPAGASRTGLAPVAVGAETAQAPASGFSAGWWVIPGALLGAAFWAALAWLLTGG